MKGVFVRWKGSFSIPMGCKSAIKTLLTPKVTYLLQNRPSQKEACLPTTIFRGYVSFGEGIWQEYGNIFGTLTPSQSKPKFAEVLLLAMWLSGWHASTPPKKWGKSVWDCFSVTSSSPPHTVLHCVLKREFILAFFKKKRSNLKILGGEFMWSISTFQFYWTVKRWAQNTRYK